MKYLYIILAMIILASCSTTKQFAVTPAEEFEAAYVNKPISEIMEEYGMPLRVEPDGNGGAVVVYEETVSEFIDMSGDSSGSSSSSSISMSSYSTSDSSSSSDDESSDDSSYSDSSSSATIYRHFYINGDNICYKVDSNDYLKKGVYRKYFNKITIMEMSSVALLVVLLNIFI